MDPNLALFDIIESTNLYFTVLQFFCVGLLFYLSLKSVIPDPFDYTFYVATTSFVSFLFALQLYFVNLIDYKSILWIIFCTILFYSGFIAGNLVVRQKVTAERHLVSRSHCIYYFIIFATSALTIYYVTGIPLFMETRLTQFSEVGGGFGVLGRIMETSRVLTIYFLFLHYTNKKLDCFFWIIAISCLLTLVASGSKGSILLFLWLAFLTNLIPRFKSLKLIYQILLIAILITYPLVIIIIQGEGEIRRAYIYLLSRIAFFGDVYAFAYPGNLIDILKKPDLLALMYPLLETFRLVDRGSSVIPGFEFMRAIHPNWDLVSGPNPRLPVYIDYFYSRYFFVIAFFFGVIFGYCSKIIRTNKKSISVSSIFVLLFFAAGSSETDPIRFVGSLANILIFLPFICANKLLRLASK